MLCDTISNARADGLVTEPSAQRLSRSHSSLGRDPRCDIIPTIVPAVPVVASVLRVSFVLAHGSRVTVVSDQVLDEVAECVFGAAADADY